MFSPNLLSLNIFFFLSQLFLSQVFSLSDSFQQTPSNQTPSNRDETSVGGAFVYCGQLGQLS